MPTPAPFPPIPVPQSMDDPMPATTEPVLAATADPDLLWKWNNNRGDNNPYYIHPWAPSQIYDRNMNPVQIYCLENVYGAPVPPHRVQFLQYWKLIDSRALRGGQPTYTYETSFTAGISVTNMKEMSATWGVQAGDPGEDGFALSASITSAFSHSVEVSSSETVTRSVTYAPIDGKDQYLNTWQLCQLFRIVDPSGNPIAPTSYDDRWAVLILPEGERQGGFVWDCTSWDVPNLHVESVATTFDRVPA